MKSLLCIWWCIILPISAFSKSYYISSSLGNDLHTVSQAQRIQTPWKSFGRLKKENLVAGDTIYLKAGDMWNEILDVYFSGSKEKPIVITSYGIGKEPELNGSVALTGWKTHKKNVYYVETKEPVKILFMNGVLLNQSRMPNDGWYWIQKAIGNQSLIAEYLDDRVINHVGSKITIRTADWELEERIVTETKKNLFSFESAIKNVPPAGNGFYLEGSLDYLDSQGEWTWKNGKLYLYLESGHKPEDFYFEAPIHSHGIILSNKNENLVISNLTIRSYNSDCVFIQDCKNITIKSLKIFNSGKRGIHIKSTKSPVEEIKIVNTIVKNTYGDGIRLGSVRGAQILDSRISRISADSISPKKSYGIIAYGSNVLIKGNIVDSTSFDGIFIGPNSENIKISENELSNTLLLLNDGGAIYTSGKHSNLSIEHNFIKNTYGNTSGSNSKKSSSVGIYLDQYCSGVIVKNNIIVNSGAYGIKLHKATFNKIINNVCYNSMVSSIRIQDETGKQKGNLVCGNIFFGLKNQLAYIISNRQSAVNNTFRNNTFFNEDSGNVVKILEGKHTSLYTLDNWKSSFGHDKISSFKNPLFPNKSRTYTHKNDFKVD